MAMSVLLEWLPHPFAAKMEKKQEMLLSLTLLPRMSGKGPKLADTHSGTWCELFHIRESYHGGQEQKCSMRLLRHNRVT